MNVTDLFPPSPDEVHRVLCARSTGVSHPTCVVLNREHELNLYRETELLHSFMCSPSELGELCVGWLVSEGYCADSVEVSSDGHTAHVRGASEPSKEPLPLRPTHTESATTEEMLALFHHASDKYARSHGVHECVIKGDGWYILRTDIGRHNAMDKAIGAALLAGYDLRGATLFSSGRINVQTVQKAARCGIGCLMSKAVITHEALLLAQTLGLSVLFSVKDNYAITGHE